MVIEEIYYLKGLWWVWVGVRVVWVPRRCLRGWVECEGLGKGVGNLRWWACSERLRGVKSGAKRCELGVNWGTFCVVIQNFHVRTSCEFGDREFPLRDSVCEEIRGPLGSIRKRFKVVVSL